MRRPAGERRVQLVRPRPGQGVVISGSVGVGPPWLGGKPTGTYLSTKTGTHPSRRYDYSAEATRWSVRNSLDLLGLGERAFRAIPVNDDFELDPGHLELGRHRHVDMHARDRGGLVLLALRRKGLVLGHE